MRAFELSRYIRKWLPLIVVVCIGLTAATYLFLSSTRMHVASAVIHYNDESAEVGETPLGGKLDVNEIRSSAIMSRVLYNLDLAGTYSVDDLISRVQITEVVDEDEAARKEALLDAGEEYEYEPTTYIVSFSAENGEGEAFARQVLDEILDQYFAEYSEKYVNLAAVNNPLRHLYQDNYDYIEMMEIVDEEITSTINAMYQRMNSDIYYRSTTTGMSFSDLTNEFEFLQKVTVSDLFSKIFQYQVTKDKEVLLSSYAARIQENGIQNLTDQEKLQDVVHLIDAYIEKMRQSGNTDITYEYILDDVYEKDLVDAWGNLVGQGDQTVTYDKLIFAWRDHSESKEYAVIDSAYCQYIIDTFSRCTGACGGAPGEGDEAGVTPCAGAPVTCSELGDVTYPQVKAQVEQGIEDLVEQLTELYDLAYATNEEYNQYLGAKSISMLSSVSVKDSVNVALYTAIAAAFFLIICCCGAILLGRLTDIVQYIFYTDHMTGLNNRSAFDRYLRSRDHLILDDGTVFAAVSITNEVEINRTHGREAGDQVIRFVAATLKSVFNKTGAYLVYNGNAQFFVVVEKTDYATAEYILHRFRLLLEQRDILAEEWIEYDLGMAESSRDQVHRVRGLLSAAMDARVHYTAGPLVDEMVREPAARG